MASFVDKDLEKIIKNDIILSVFPSLDTNNRNMLGDYIVKIIELISVCFYFSRTKYETYVHQLTQNNNQDIKWILAHLLPFVNKNNNISKITTLAEIYYKKENECDINKEEPKYLFSNIQYNRCIRTLNSYTEAKIDIKQELDNNYYLLVETIRTISHKLCINWINILPYSMKDYRKSRMYEHTIENLTKKRILYWNPCVDTNANLPNDTVSKNLKKYHNLYIGQIYETIADLYYSIKDYKWIIYLIVDKKMKSMVLFLKKLFSSFETSMFFKYATYAELSEDQHVLFDIALESIFDETKFDKQTCLDFIAYFLSSFEKNKKFYNNAISENYSKLPKLKSRSKSDNIDEDENDDGYNKPIYFDELKKSFTSLEPKFIYEFIVGTFAHIKYTWYGYVLLNDEKTDFKTDEFNLNDLASDYYIDKKESFFKTPETLYLNNELADGRDKFSLELKNIYNFAKNFCHYVQNDEFLPFPKNWISLTSEDKKIIENRLNGDMENGIKWFNISGFIKRFELYTNPQILKYVTGDHGNGKKNVIVQFIKAKIYGMIKHSIIDIVFQSLIHSGLLSEFIPDKFRSDLSLLPNTSLDSLSTNENQKKIFEESEENKYWTDCYHYLTMQRYKNMAKFKNNDKEYTYFSNALETVWFKAGAYDWIGQIGFCHHFMNNVVTFLTAPTGIGKSVEIPKLYLYYSKAIDNILMPKVACSQPRKAPVENAKYVATMLGVPIKNNGEKMQNYFIQYKHSDGGNAKNVNHPVLRYITGDTLLYQFTDPMLKEKSGNKEKENEQYLQDNIYDIIMIDESHEHVSYMDLLLTYLKSTLMINNSVKLIIVTATMDDDEARYRRFFRDINDNRKYPLSTFISENTIDRICVDRRFHMAIPKVGSDTRHKIIEHYRPLKNKSDEDKQILEIVNEILLKETECCILIFEPGEANINKLITLLNKNTRQNVIALPFYSKLNEKKQDVIKKIGVHKQYVKMSKDANFALVDHTKGTGNYNIVIIVATGIAEASITIDGLKYVIDTGTTKKPLYDYEKRNEVLLTSDIAESSRIQRKGRVGRTAPGEVYYLYEKDKMKNNKLLYEISQRDMSNSMLQYLRNDIEDINYAFSIDTNFPKFNKNLILQDIPKKYKRVYESQYFLKKVYYSYYGNDSLYDYDNYKREIVYYETGFDYETISDLNGKFYLIHPEETNLIRNICGDITNTKSGKDFVKLNKYSGKIISKKMSAFWQNLYNFMYINENKRKTDFGKFMTEMQSKDNFIFIDSRLIRTLIFGIFNGCDEHVAVLCAMIQALDFDISNLYTKHKNKYGYDESDMIFLHANVDEQKSDLDMIDEHFKKIFEQVAKNVDFGKHFNLHSSEYLTKQDLKDENINLSPEESINLVLGNATKIINSTEKNTYDSKIKSIISKNFEKKMKETPEIKIRCDGEKINFEIIVKFYKIWSSMRLTIHSIKKENETFVNSMIEKFKLLHSISTPTKISFLFGFSQNIVKWVKNSVFMSLNSNSVIFSISKLNNKILKTYVGEKFTKNYMLYLQNNVEKNEMTMMTYVTLDEVLLLSYIYNDRIKTFKKISSSDLIEAKNNEKLVDKKIINFLVSYGEEIETIKIDFSQNIGKIQKYIEFVKTLYFVK